MLPVTCSESRIRVSQCTRNKNKKARIYLVRKERSNIMLTRYIRGDETTVRQFFIWSSTFSNARLVLLHTFFAGKKTRNKIICVHCEFVSSFWRGRWSEDMLPSS